MGENYRPFSIGALAVIVLAIAAAVLLDWLTGPMASPLVFYLAAVVIVSIRSGQVAGLVTTLAAVVAWHVLSEREVTYLALAWNVITRLATLGIATLFTTWLDAREIELPV